MATAQQALLDILISPERGKQRTTAPSPAQTSQPSTPGAPTRTQLGQAPITPTSQPASPSAIGFSDIGDAFRVITENPIEFAIPAALGIPLEQVLAGAISRSQRAKQITTGDKKKPDLIKRELSVLDDVLSAKGDFKEIITKALLSVLGI